MYINAYTYTYTHIHTNMHTYQHTCIHTCMQSYIPVHIYVTDYRCESCESHMTHALNKERYKALCIDIWFCLHSWYHIVTLNSGK